MKVLKGSQNEVISLIEKGIIISKLEEIIDDSTVQFSKKDKNKPLKDEDFKEAELKNFLKETSRPELGGQIRDWWLKVYKYNTRTPNWDFVSTCTIDGQEGLLLVEAKAHTREVKKNEKCGSTNKENREKIEKAIEKAKKEINNLNPSIDIKISKDNCYQLSNRVAHAWWLANNGIPVILLYLGFLNCNEMEKNGKIFENNEDWQNCFQKYASSVGVDIIIDKSINCGKSKFKLICRSLEAI